MRPENVAALAASTLPGSVKLQLERYLETGQFHHSKVSGPEMTRIAAQVIRGAEHDYAAWQELDSTRAQEALDAAFYGTTVPRERTPDRPGRAKDGWRHLCSHPVTLGGVTYDVILAVLPERFPVESEDEYALRVAGAVTTAHAATLQQYHALSKAIQSGGVTL